MQREHSDDVPELMDLPNLDENALRNDLLHLAKLNRTFGGRKAVETVFHRLAEKGRNLVLVDLASGYGDHGRNLIQHAEASRTDITIFARRQTISDAADRPRCHARRAEDVLRAG